MMNDNKTPESKNFMSSSHVDHEFEEINSLIENLDFENAKVLLQKKLKQDSGNTTAMDLMSEVYLGLDDTENAIKVIIKIIL
jgi:hypothetical protein